MISWSQEPDIQRYYEPDLLARYIRGHSSAGSAEPSKGGHIAVVPWPSLNPPSYRADGRMRRVVLIGYGMKRTSPASFLTTWSADSMDCVCWIKARSEASFNS